MPDRPPREDMRRSKTLNALILVTLVTVIVALGYLGNYYLGVGSSHQITWYPTNPFCNVAERRCTASLGQRGEISLSLDKRETVHDALIQASVSSLKPSRVDVLLEARDRGRVVETMTLDKIAPHRFVGRLPLDWCNVPHMRWRLKVVVHSGQQNLGGWFDFDTTCKNGQAVSALESSAR
ncbi:hypothetical protein [Larsenimonas salina]|uniref:hypothetical protein n=1 Tax=Larsenimonas salina TaxID=1295565 RepID=UPI0020744417|nr:hypothetical protein [Larsenimonas salina]MCM5705255.1 hypothetical protein [Larsenimonas salina]